VDRKAGAGKQWLVMDHWRADRTGSRQQQLTDDGQRIKRALISLSVFCKPADNGGKDIQKRP
jgi:hypothetical protein